MIFAFEVRRRRSPDTSQHQPEKGGTKTRGKKCGGKLTIEHFQNGTDEEPRAEVDNAVRGEKTESVNESVYLGRCIKRAKGGKQMYDAE
uniref:Uncharacterized protein n=1 Tax=Ascaris lumbricoides TaxID=6252 RepID=A0A0M3ID36_ASCLU